MSKKPSNIHSEPKAPPLPSSFAGTILRKLLEISASLLDDRQKKGPYSNQDALLAEVFLWDEIASYAKKYAEGLWEMHEKAGLYKRPDEVGEHSLIEGRSFYMTANVTKPVKRFNANALLMILKKSKFKIPEPVARQFIEEAKVPGASQCKLNIEER